ncbi:serine dehydratase beta chain, partial [Vibrio sp. 10N.261.52.A1]
MLSIFDIYKIGVGPSSSHTNGPMIAGFHFTQLIADRITEVVRVQVDLYGSLSLTGIGHHTDRATILGLLGNKPDTIKITSANEAMRRAIDSGEMQLSGSHAIGFNYQTDMLFHEDNLPLHENGMMITAFDQAGKVIVDETYYSIGGGFIATADELQNGTKTQSVEVAYPFKNADEMLQQAEKNGMSLGGM